MAQSRFAGQQGGSAVTKRLFLLLARLALGGVFVYAAVGKILDPAAFARAIANYQILPVALVNLLAITLPWIELWAGAFLVIGFWVRPSALLTGAMMGVFIIAISQAIARDLDIRCGCFGTSGGRQVSAIAVLEDSTLLALSLWLLWRQPKQPKEKPS